MRRINSFLIFLIDWTYRFVLDTFTTFILDCTTLGKSLKKEGVYVTSSSNEHILY
jgi:hypothetical protein